MEQRQYLCIDQKSYYATVECVARGLDPMTTDLVVADPERSENTICLAVSAHLKKRGVQNRCRIKDIPSSLKYIIAQPRMQLYIDCAAEIYGVFLKYLAPEDIYVYSIDESFLDVTPYLKMYGLPTKELAKKIMQDVKDTVGTICTCGIGTNLYLAKIALDLTAKHADDFIGELDEESYREKLWDHKPITDFWRISHGTEARLKRYGISTMRDIALFDEDCLYRCFGVDAELLIDHAWGREPTTIRDIKNYKCIRNLMQKYVSKAQTSHPDLFQADTYSPHSMRHSKAVHMLEAGVDMVFIRDFLGHASIQTTEIYATVSQALLNKTLRARKLPELCPGEEVECTPDAIPDYLKRKRIN